MNRIAKLMEGSKHDPIAQRIIDIKVGDVLPIKNPQLLGKIKKVNEGMLIGYALDIDEEKMTIRKVRPTLAETLLWNFGMD
tara:strand:+ start:385 stop:627 length:243 start_codon:yes stop_codon:yes gene_type:complete